MRETVLFVACSTGASARTSMVSASPATSMVKSIVIVVPTLNVCGDALSGIGARGDVVGSCRNAQDRVATGHVRDRGPL
jgi:hypothetical protein